MLRVRIWMCKGVMAVQHFTNLETVTINLETVIINLETGNERKS